MNLLAPLIDRIERQSPQTKIILSATTQTGYDVAAKKYPHLHCIWFPFDFTWAVRRTIARLKPDMLVLSELEIWPNLVVRCRQQNVSIGVINGRLSENSFRGYRRFRRLLKPVFASLDFVLAQNETYAQRFLELGVRSDCLTVVGSIKFDGAETNRANPRTCELAELAEIQSNDIVFLAGSTQSPEEEYAVETFRKLCKAHPELRLIIVPRHPERFNAVANMLDSSGLPWQRRSDLRGGPRNDVAENQRPRILLVDTIGELGTWWGTAHLAFVGGSFGDRGGQNMIEPAAYGAAVSFGPNTRNFRDIVQMLLKNEAAVRLKTPEDLTDFVGRAITDYGFRESLGNNAKRLVATQQGAADRTTQSLLQMLRLEVLTQTQEKPGISDAA